MNEAELAVRIAGMRTLSRVLADAELNRRLDACGRFGEQRVIDEDPLGRVLGGHRDRYGVDWVRRSGPIGVVALAEADKERIAEVVLGGNACVWTGLDDGDIRRGIARAGFPEDVVARFDELPQVEVDALWRGRGDIVLAERTGGSRHVYVDAGANEHHVAYVCVNAASHRSADTFVFHSDFPQSAAEDVRNALETLGESATFLTVANVTEAAETVDAASSGEVETIMTTNLVAMREFMRRVDAAVVLVNASPALVEDHFLTRSLRDFTRSRWEGFGDGQTLPLGQLPL